MNYANSTDNRKAVVVGCDYVGCGENELFGCCKDAWKIVGLLLSRGYSKSNICILVDRPRPWGKCKVAPKRPTKNNIMEALYWLFEDDEPSFTKGKELDTILSIFFSKSNTSGPIKREVSSGSKFFSFSGHGSYIDDVSGDEADGRDECLLAVPPTTTTDGIVTIGELDDSCFIVDDEIREAIASNSAKGGTLMMLVDACHSGTVSDLASGETKDVRKFGDKLKDVRSSDTFVVCISGCRDEGVSLETQNGGVLTSSFLEAVYSFSDSKFPRIEHLFDKIKSEVRKESDQEPQISHSNILCLEHRIHEFL